MWFLTTVCVTATPGTSKSPNKQQQQQQSPPASGTWWFVAKRWLDETRGLEVVLDAGDRAPQGAAALEYIITVHTSDVRWVERRMGGIIAGLCAVDASALVVLSIGLSALELNVCNIASPLPATSAPQPLAFCLCPLSGGYINQPLAQVQMMTVQPPDLTHVRMLPCTHSLTRATSTNA